MEGELLQKKNVHDDDGHNSGCPGLHRACRPYDVNTCVKLTWRRIVIALYNFLIVHTRLHVTIDFMTGGKFALHIGFPDCCETLQTPQIPPSHHPKSTAVIQTV